jgi:hypothetical protein
MVTLLILYSNQKYKSDKIPFTVFMSIVNTMCKNMCLNEGHALLGILPMPPSTILHKKQLVIT